METNNTTRFLKVNINDFCSPQNNKGGFSFIYTNIRSLRKNFNDLLVDHEPLVHVSHRVQNTLSNSKVLIGGVIWEEGGISDDIGHPLCILHIIFDTVIYGSYNILH